MGISTQSLNLSVQNYAYSGNYSVSATSYSAGQNVTNNVFINAGYEQEAQAPVYDYNQQQAPVTNNYFISVGNQAQENVAQPQINIFNIGNNPVSNILNALKAAKNAQQNQNNINSLKGIVNYLKTLIEYKKTMDELAAVKKEIAKIKKNKDWSVKTDAQKEKDAGKICNKLDKLGFKKKLVDKLQTVLEKGNIEDLPKSKLKKFNKIMNKIADVTKNSVRLTRAQIAKYSAMIEEAVKMVTVDKDKLAA